MRPLLWAGLSLSGALGVVLFGGREARQVSLFPPAPTLVSSANACPLTPAEENDAIEKFDKLWPVFRHPRCLNCHGGVNPYVPEKAGGHRGGAIKRGPELDSTLARCQECHSELPGWDIPVSSFFFTGKSARQICIQMKQTEADPVQFMSHITNDKGLVAFTETAFKGDRALNTLGQDMVEETTLRPFTPEPPPMSHQEFVELGRRWANAIGYDAWKASKDCGCARKTRSWSGTINGTWDFDLGEAGHARETTRTNVRFEIDSSFAPGPDTYWKSVSGEIVWSTVISGGKCQASAGGTVAIGIGGDDNPMGLLSLRTSQPEKGPHYVVATGPWRDEDQPRFSVKCVDSPPFAGTLYGAYIWWYHSIDGMRSPDGKTLKGSYSGGVPGSNGTMTFDWDLQLDEDAGP